MFSQQRATGERREPTMRAPLSSTYRARRRQKNDFQDNHNLSHRRCTNALRSATKKTESLKTLRITTCRPPRDSVNGTTVVRPMLPCTERTFLVLCFPES